MVIITVVIEIIIRVEVGEVVNVGDYSTFQHTNDSFLFPGKAVSVFLNFNT